MSLTARLTELVQACFTGIWIESHEHEDALAEMTALCRQESWQLLAWDVDQGLRNLLAGDAPLGEGAGDPLAAIRALGGLASEDSSSLLVLVDSHWFLQSAEIAQTLARQIAHGKQHRTFVVTGSAVCERRSADDSGRRGAARQRLASARNAQL